MRSTAAAAVIAALAGCAGAPVEVAVPVTPPVNEWLRAPAAPIAPTWVEPQAPEASSALSAAEEARLLEALRHQREQIDGWRAWYEAQLRASELRRALEASWAEQSRQVEENEE